MRFYNNTVFYFAALLYFIWSLILIISDTPLHTTSIENIWVLFHSFQIAGFIFLISSLLAFGALFKRKVNFLTTLLLMPQEFFLLWSSIGIIFSISEGAYADGIVHPRSFIFVDQLIYLLLAFFHTVNMINIKQSLEIKVLIV